MLFKKIALALIVGVCLFSATTNATTNAKTPPALKANQCTLALLPFSHTMVIETQKEEILKAYEDKGFFVTLVTSLNAANEFEFYADASVDCTSTYFGTAAQTTIRLVEVATNKILSRAQTPVVMELFSCKVELQKAIAALPHCSLK